MTKKYLIIGGLGFVGKNLTRYLRKNGHFLTIIDKKDPDSQDKEFLKSLKINFLKGDVLHPDPIREIISEHKYEGVFHLASFVGIRNYLSNPAGVIETTILGTLNIAKACYENGIHMLFTSTSEVLGRNPSVPWKENADRLYGSTDVERWSYGSSKGVAEQLILGLVKEKNLSSTIIRFFNVYGDYQSPIFVIPKTLSNCMNNIEPLVYDAGTQTRCFTYVQDAVEALEVLMEQKKNGIYHIGSNYEHTMMEAVECIIKNTNPSLKPRKVSTEEMYGNSYEDISRRVPDVSKIKKEIGWIATTPLEKGVKRTVEWVKKNKWWLKIDSSVSIN